MSNDLLSTAKQPSFLSAALRSHRIRGLVFLLASLGGLYYFFLSTTRHFSPSPNNYVEDNLPSGFKADPLEQRIQGLINNHQIMVFSKSYCPYSAAAKKLLRSYTDDVQVLEVDLEGKSALEDDSVVAHSFDDIIVVIPIGGSDNLRALHESGELDSRLRQLGVKVKEDHP
ncbi:hypothetical protein BGW42_008659 [Actinomortierella wolfii]|nr:hypothetical protein BGW42_008659 [Actinomortierella wolfii]